MLFWISKTNDSLYLCGFDTALCVLMVYSHKTFYTNHFVANMFINLYLNEICILYVLDVAVVITMQNMQLLRMIIFCTLFIIEIFILKHVRQISNIWNIKHIFKIYTCINDYNISFLISLIRDCLLNNDTSQYIVRKLASIALLTLFWNVAVNWQGKVIKQ